MAVPVSIDEDLLRELWPQKLSLRALADRLNCSTNTISRAGARLDLGPRRGRTRVPLPPCRDCGYGYDRAALAPHGCPRCNAGSVANDDHDEMMRLWEAEATCAAIGLLMGLQPSSISRRRKALGLTPRLAPRGEPEPESKPVALTAKPEPAPEPEVTPLEADILVTEGRYAALNRVCERHGITMVRAQQLWHRLRVGLPVAGPNRDEPATLSSSDIGAGDRGRRVEIPRDEIAALVADGLSNAELAERYGTSDTTILNRLRKYGIKRSAA